MCNLLINESPLQVLPTLATWIGLNEAMFLQQLHYWMSNTKIGKVVDEVKWVRNTIDEWQESNFPFWDIGVIKRTIKNLEKDGLLLSDSRLNKMNIDRTKWYTINYAMLESLDGPVDRIAAKIAKRKSACNNRDGVMTTRKEQSVLIAKEQSVPMDTDENKVLPCIGTKCSEGLEQNVPTNNQRLHRDYTETTEVQSPPKPKKRKKKESIPIPAAVDVYRSIALLFPKKTLWTVIDQAIGNKQDDLDHFGEVLLWWIGQGYKPININGIIDVYQNGDKHGKAPARNGQPGTTSNTSGAKESHTDVYRRENKDHISAGIAALSR